MGPPPQPTQVKPEFPDSDDERPPSPVPKALEDVQQTLLGLEYSIRHLYIIAADVQPPKPNDHPQGRLAERV